MYGWRARLGLIVPSTNTVMESELRKYSSEEISIHTDRMFIEAATVENLIRMHSYSKKCAKCLASAKVDVIIYGCTAGSLIKGKGYEKEIEKEIEDLVGIPTVTASSAVVDFLKSKKIKKIVVATPYIDELNKKEKEFLEEYGFEVIAIRGLGIKNPVEIGKLDPHIAYYLSSKLLKENDGADALFISCTDFRTFEIIKPLIRDFNKPVISSNLASLWSALRKVNVSTSLLEADLINL